jgi:hypothetical protein
MFKINVHKLTAYGPIGTLLLGGVLLVLGGCATATGPVPSQASSGGTQIGNASVIKVRMAHRIFLPPVSPSQKVIFIERHNLSSAQGFNFNHYLVAKLTKACYRFTNYPSKAHAFLMYTIPYIGKETKDATAAGALASGFSGTLAQRFLPSADKAFWERGKKGAPSGYIGTFVKQIIEQSLSKNTYMMVVDIRVMQKGNAKASKAFSTNSSRDWKTDRVVVQVRGYHLNFGYVEPALEKVMAGEIAGIFGVVTRCGAPRRAPSAYHVDAHHGHLRRKI